MNSLKLPPHWIHCPRKGELIQGLFLPFKTPLDSRYFSKIKPASYFIPEMIISLQKTNNFKIGLWIDLTNTSRYYKKEVIENSGIKYVKINCKGHEGAPTIEQTTNFIDLCDKFFEQTSKVVALHCTHGFNRTGFLICSYLCEKLDWSPNAALSVFACSRPPGIYKQEYINELLIRYGDSEFTIKAPEKPDWCYLDKEINDDGNEINEVKLNRSIQIDQKIIEKKHTFMEGITGVEIISDVNSQIEIQNEIKSMFKWKMNGFIGSQPVSMTIEDLNKLRDLPYKVSWKADGVRFLMYINGKNQVYLIGRDNIVFKIIQGCPLFPRRKKLNEHLIKTLLDGEMIIDVLNGVNYPKFLVYDILKFEDISVHKENFDIRTQCIFCEIIEPRNEAKFLNIIDGSLESFSIRLKEFWNIKFTKSLFGEKFTKNICHEVDGLIFQPINSPYIPGSFNLLLKWKPPSLNSIDFKVKISKENNQGCLPETYAYLYVGQKNEFIAKIKASKEFWEHNNKIIECTYDYINRTWKFLRVRTDKSFPNSLETANAVFETIKNPLTKEYLLEFIQKLENDKHQNSYCQLNDSKGLMLPPPPR